MITGLTGTDSLLIARRSGSPGEPQEQTFVQSLMTAPHPSPAVIPSFLTTREVGGGGQRWRKVSMSEIKMVSQKWGEN